MKKKEYEKPTCKVYDIKPSQILCGSPNTPPENVPGYDDWLG